MVVEVRPDIIRSNPHCGMRIMPVAMRRTSYWRGPSGTAPPGWNLSLSGGPKGELEHCPGGHGQGLPHLLLGAEPVGQTPSLTEQRHLITCERPGGHLHGQALLVLRQEHDLSIAVRRRDPAERPLFPETEAERQRDAVPEGNQPAIAVDYLIAG